MSLRHYCAESAFFREKKKVFFFFPQVVLFLLSCFPLSSFCDVFSARERGDDFTLRKRELPGGISSLKFFSRAVRIILNPGVAVIAIIHAEIKCAAR